MSREESKSMGGTPSVPYVYWLLLLLMVAAFAWRMQGVTQWPMPFHPTLQYEYALNARAIWYMTKEVTEKETKWLNEYQGRQKGLWLIEACTATVYWMCGKELPWVSGIFTSLCWIAGAWLLFQIAFEQGKSSIGALAAACFFLLHPFCIVVSRSFQHEAASMMGWLFAWWWLSREDALANRSIALFTGVVCGMAMLFKPGIVWIPLCFVHLGYSVQRHGWRKTLVSPWLYLVPIIALVPSVLWMKFIFNSHETHQWKWPLLLDGHWYIQTGLHMIRVVGWFSTMMLLVLVAWNIFKRQWFIPILAVGFIVYAAVFNYACMTHDYYLLPLFPILALVWGQLFSGRWLYDLLKQRVFIMRQFLIPLLITLFSFGMTHWADWDDSMLSAGPYSPEKQIALELRRQLGAGTQIIALTNDYAMPLRYFSGLHAQWWPTHGDLWYEGLAGGRVLSARERLKNMLSKTNARYFIITLEEEYQQQKDLVEALKQFEELSTHPESVRIFALHD